MVQRRISVREQHYSLTNVCKAPTKAHILDIDAHRQCRHLLLPGLPDPGKPSLPLDSLCKEVNPAYILYNVVHFCEPHYTAAITPIWHLLYKYWPEKI